MKTYLAEFFKEFSYEGEDAAFLLAAYDRIEGNREAFSLWQEALALYDADIACEYSEILKKADGAADLTGLHEYTAELLIFICMTRRLRALYAESKRYS